MPALEINEYELGLIERIEEIIKEENFLLIDKIMIDFINKILELWGNKTAINKDKISIHGTDAYQILKIVRKTHNIKRENYDGEVASDYIKLKKSIKYRECNFGKNNPMYNKKPWNKDENRKDEIIEKLGKYWRGKTFSKSHKSKLAKAKEGITGKDANAYGSHDISPEGKIAMMKGTLHAASLNSSKGENRLGNYLNSIHNDCENQKRIKFWLVDFYLPSMNTVIEFDGKYWHAGIHNLIKEHKLNKQQRNCLKNDKAKNTYLKNNNIKVIRILETDFYKHEKIGDVEEWLKKLLK